MLLAAPCTSTTVIYPACSGTLSPEMLNREICRTLIQVPVKNCVQQWLTEDVGHVQHRRGPRKLLIGLSVKQDYNNAARHRAPVVFIVISRLPVGVRVGEDTLIIVVGTDVQTGPHFLL